MGQVKLLQASLIPVGWISRKHLASGRGRTFFLTSLLIELIDTRRRVLTSPSVWSHYKAVQPPSMRRV
jgi:hypothetical protein